MLKHAKRVVTGLLVSAAAALAVVAAASPAQAVDAQKCSAWVQLTPGTNLHAYTCVKRQGTNIWSWTRVKNFDGVASYFVDRIEVNTTAGGWRQCASVGWIGAGQFRECVSYSVFDAGGSDYGTGWILYWTGVSYVWQYMNSPSV